eukprot:199415-Pelagomonas_calceolata.AAC.3
MHALWKGCIATPLPQVRLEPATATPWDGAAILVHYGLGEIPETRGTPSCRCGHSHMGAPDRNLTLSAKVMQLTTTPELGM